MYRMIHFLCIQLKNNSIWKFFQVSPLFLFYRYYNYKQIGWGYTGTHFLGPQIVVFEKLLKLQTNLMAEYRSHIFKDFKYRYLNHKQKWWRYTGNAFLRLQHRYFWRQNDTFMLFFWEQRWDQISIKLALTSFVAYFNSEYNLFLLETSHVHQVLEISLYVKKYLKCYPKQILFYRFTDTTLVTIQQWCCKYNSGVINQNSVAHRPMVQYNTGGKYDFKYW